MPVLPSTNPTDKWLRGDASWQPSPSLAITTTSTFTWPAVAGTVAITIDSSALMRVGMALYFPALGVAELTVIGSGTSITIRNNGNSGNAGSTAGVAIGTQIFAGTAGALATSTTSGMIPTPPNTTTTFLRGDATFTTPPSATATVAGYVPTPPNDTTKFFRGDATFTVVPTATGTTGGLLPVPPNTTTTFLRGDATFTTPPSATATVAGYVPTPPNNTYQFLRGDATWAKPDGTATATTSTFTVPAAHATVVVAISAVTWPIVGQKVYVTDGTLIMYGNVTAVGSSTSVTVRNTGDTGNSVSGTMATGASFVLVGFQTPMFRQWQAAIEYSPPATLYAVFGVQNARAHLAFNDSATWTANFYGVVPSGTYLGAGLIVRLKWKSITVTTGNAVWNSAVERLNTAESADSFDTAATVTAGCSATQSALVESVIGPFTTIDSITAGDGIGLQIQRIGANGSDSLVGDACLRTVSIESVI